MVTDAGTNANATTSQLPVAGVAYRAIAGVTPRSKGWRWHIDVASHRRSCAISSREVWHAVFSRKRVMRAVFAGHSFAISLDIVAERESPAPNGEKTCSFN
jgi:hypothetical protein